MNVPLGYEGFKEVRDSLPTRFVVVRYEAQGVFQAMLLADGFSQTFSHSAASEPETFSTDFPDSILVPEALL